MRIFVLPKTKHHPVMNRTTIPSLIFLLSLLCACSMTDHNAGTATIHRLDLATDGFQSLSQASQSAICDSMADGIKALQFLQGDTAAPVAFLRALSQTPPVKIFTPDIRKRIPSLDSIESVLAREKQSMTRLFPEVKFPTMYAIVSSYNQSIFNVDSIMLVGLNHYLGSDYEGYGYFEPYQRSTKTMRHLPYDIAESILADNFPYRPGEGETVLNRMLYEGALLEAVMQLVPEASLSEALGYTPRQLQWAEANEKNAWEAIISRKILYSTDPLAIDRMVIPSPATTLLHPDSPGRMGRYIGYRIVQSYLSHTADSSLSHLLSPSFYNSSRSLINAKYSPE